MHQLLTIEKTANDESKTWKEVIAAYFKAYFAFVLTKRAKQTVVTVAIIKRPNAFVALL